MVGHLQSIMACLLLLVVLLALLMVTGLKRFACLARMAVHMCGREALDF